MGGGDRRTSPKQRPDAATCYTKGMPLPSYGTEYVPIEPLRAHLNDLRRRGMTRRRIADLSGVSITTIANLLQTHPTKARSVYTRAMASTAEVLYSVTADQGASGTSLIPSASTQRRIQALVMMGYSRAMIGERLGISKQRLVNIENSPTLTRASAARVRAFYLRFSETKPTYRDNYERAGAFRAQAQGKAKGWRVPRSWVDIERGIPTARRRPVPKLMGAVIPGHSSELTIRRLQALAVMGYSPSMIALGIGSSKSSVSKIDESDTISLKLAESVRVFYQRSILTKPLYRDGFERGGALRTQQAAKERGWLGPLDWEDIERGIVSEDYEEFRDQSAVDPEAVSRATSLALKRKTEDIGADTLTLAEKEQVARNLHLEGFGVKSISRLTKIGRHRVIRLIEAMPTATVTAIVTDERAAA